MRKETKISLNVILPLVVSLITLIIAFLFSDKSFASLTKTNKIAAVPEVKQLAASTGSLYPTGSQAVVPDVDVPVYNFEMQNQKAIKESYPLVSYLRTTVGVGSANIIGVPSLAITGLSGDELGICAASAMYDALEKISAFDLLTNSSFSKEALSRSTTEAKNIGCADIGTDGLMGRKGAGSLMSVAKLAFDTVVSDPIPVNLAYYGKDVAQRIPILKDTAYAADNQYQLMGGTIALSFWKVTRNIAYGMMAIIMLVIGVMIIMRKEVGRAYVTVQTVIPRVVISLILITFSYPIGALMAGMITHLMVFGSLVILSSVLGSSGDGNPITSALDAAKMAKEMTELVSPQKLMVYALIAVVILGPAGMFAIVIGLLMLALTLFALIAAAVKIMIIYLHIMMDIVFAPIQFAIAALPGKEDIIPNWFKKMAAKVLAAPAIIMFVVLAWVILTRPLTDPNFFMDLARTNSPTDIIGNIAGVGTALFSLFMIPFIAIMTLFFSLKVDKKIEEFIVGAPKKR